MIISIMNFKGGVAKTTTAVNLAYLAATVKNKRVLVIDNDPQGNASTFFQIDTKISRTLPQIITDMFKKKRDSIMPIIPYHTQYKRIDILPSDMNLSTCNMSLSKYQSKISMLYKAILESIIQKYDVIIIDNAPNVTPLTVSALLASEQVIVPVNADKLTIDGLNEIIKQIDDARLNGFSKLKLGGILFTRFNSRARVDRETMKYVKNGTLTGGIKYKVYDSAIRQTVKVQEATFLKQPLEIACKKSNAANDYRNLINEIFNK